MRTRQYGISSAPVFMGCCVVVTCSSHLRCVKFLCPKSHAMLAGRSRPRRSSSELLRQIKSSSSAKRSVSCIQTQNTICMQRREANIGGCAFSPTLLGTEQNCAWSCHRKLPAENNLRYLQRTVKFQERSRDVIEKLLPAPKGSCDLKEEEDDFSL